MVFNPKVTQKTIIAQEPGRTLPSDNFRLMPSLLFLPSRPRPGEQKPPIFVHEEVLFEFWGTNTANFVHEEVQAHIPSLVQPH